MASSTHHITGNSDLKFSQFEETEQAIITRAVNQLVNNSRSFLFFTNQIPNNYTSFPITFIPEVIDILQKKGCQVIKIPHTTPDSLSPKHPKYQQYLKGYYVSALKC